VPEVRIDAIARGDVLTLQLAEELERLAPFGQGNPPVSLLVPAAQLADPRQLGEGRHVAFTLHAGGASSRCVQFGSTRLPAQPDEPVDVAVRLEANRWNGSIEPRLVLRHARPSRPAPIEIIGEPDFADGVDRELTRDLTAWTAEPAGVAADRRATTGIAGLLSDLVSTGEPVLGIVAHAPHRARALRNRVGGFAICSWAAVEDDPQLARDFAHVVAIDPPRSPRLLGLLEHPSVTARAHLAWGPAELRFARRIHQWDFALRDPLTALYRALRGAGEVRGEALEAALRGEGPQPRSAALAGRLVRVLSELDLVVLDREGQALRLTEAPVRTALERSEAYQAYHRRLEDGLRYLTSETIQQAA
jgi:single-stranded-DNA-specific exonuclease